MPIPIITASERAKEVKGIKGCILGKSGIGKTSLLWTLDPERTLFVALEPGELAVEGWTGDSIRPRTWQECRDLAVFLGGPSPTAASNQSYSQAHFDHVCELYGDPKQLQRYDTLFIDSLTEAGRLSLRWCKQQPKALAKSGEEDTRAVYGLHGQEMVHWLTHLQHILHKNVWFVGILQEKLDDLNRRYYEPQIDGSKTGLELPGIVDELITMTELKDDDGKLYRAFVCHTLNPWGVPAKDRGGRLAMIEEPHLGKLMDKIRTPLDDRSKSLAFDMKGTSDEGKRV